MTSSKLIAFQARRLHHAEYAQFISRFLDDLDKSGLRYNTDEVLTQAVAQVRTKLPAFKKALEQVRASDKTELLAEKDKQRDNDFRVLKDSLKLYRHSRKPAEQAAYTSLNLLFKQHKLTHRTSYEAETTLLTALLDKLALAPYQEQVTTLGIKKFVDNLAESNSAFDTLFASRSKENLTKVSYDTKALRAELATAYQQVADYIQLMSQLKALKLYKDLLDVVNNSRAYYADVIVAKRVSPQKLDSSAHSQ